VIAHRSIARLGALLLSIVALAACGRGTAVGESITYTRDVAPLVFAHCAPCHRPGQPVPFTLLDYEDVRARVGNIVHVTQTRRMPPWLPDPGDPPFVGERRLSSAEIDTLKRWADAGAPEGDPADLPSVPSWPSGWALGTPDLVVTPPAPYVLRPGGHDAYRNIVVPRVVSQNRYVRAVEFNPGTSVVHHAVLRVDRSGNSRTLDGQDPEPGFDGMVDAGVDNPEGHFIGWAPGRGPIVAPDGMPWRLDAGTDLVVELHLMPATTPTEVKPAIALYFTETTPTAQPVMLIMGSKAIDIPPGTASYWIEDRYRLPVGVDVLSLYPHAHYLGKEMHVEALLPDGTVRRLLHIPQWNFGWQQDYRFTTPVPLSQGTTLVMRYSYDNSEANRSNPHGPPRRVTWGPRSSDEMGNLGVQVIARSPSDAAALVASFARHAAETDVAGAELLLRADPDNPANETLLGSSYVRVGRFADAIRHLERALRLDPRSSRAANFLGGALLATGRADEAVTHFRKAVQSAPDDAHLRFNLARALETLGDADAAMQALRQAIKIDPQLVDAHQQLGVLLYGRGQRAEAITHLTEAARLAPSSPVAHAALGGALAQAGRRDEARSHLERALALDPSNAAARENLSRLARR
jgi:Flp pilus assembly protein TadD